MSDLQKILVDRDLVTLNDIIESEAIPQRDWSAIIVLYNINNTPFPISAIACAKIVEEIKNGLKPTVVFKAKGLIYRNFLNRYNKDIQVLENLISKDYLTNDELNLIQSLRNDPFFILGQDLERVRAQKFTELQLELRDLMSAKPETFLSYMKEFHAEEFEQKQEVNEHQIIIKFDKGILESI